MKKIIVRYEQIFMGEIIEDSYTTYIENEIEKVDICEQLYEDPHVINVEIKEVDKWKHYW